MWGGTDWLSCRARLSPDKLAVVEVRRSLRLSYRELEMRATRAARFLKEQGVRRGERVALLAPNSVAYLELLFAAEKLGAIFVPLNYRFSEPELEYVLQDCTPQVLVVEEPYEQLGRRLAERVQVSLVQESAYEQAVTAGPLLDAADGPQSPEEPWAIIYTGGTTGRSKGAVLSHRAIVWNAINTIASWGLTERDVTPVYIPMFHTGGLNALTTPILYVGGTVVIGQEFRADAVLEVMERERCTIALFVPTMYHMLVTAPEFATAKLSAMHTFLSGGAPCPHAIYEACWSRGFAFKEGYGLTEAGPNNFFIRPDQAKGRIGSVGVPMLHNEIRLVDESGRDVRPGETGEIWIRGPHVFSGYWNKPEATAETLVNGWLRTGDLGERDAEGFYYIRGRQKDMIITGGENVYPLEVEHVLAAHPSVSEVAVIGLSDSKWGEVVTAVIVPLKGHSLQAEDVKEYCMGRLAGYKIPKRIVLVPELPKTSVGKIDKKRLVQAYSQQTGA
jgi:fatty-acyl-CoA synthase